MYLITKENLELLEKIIVIQDELDVTGYENIAIMFHSLTSLRNVVNQTKQNPLSEDVKENKDG
jgi:phosphotransferase system IIB component